MSEAVTRHDRPSTEPAYDLGVIERDLRTAGGIEDPRIMVTGRSARLYFDSWEPNEATRSRTLAGVCSVIAESEHWELVSIHDPHEREESNRISNALTVRRADDDA